jgi:hypothetical protein
MYIETHVMVQFLAPEIMIMGERNFMDKTNIHAVGKANVKGRMWCNIILQYNVVQHHTKEPP